MELHGALLMEDFRFTFPLGVFDRAFAILLLVMLSGCGGSSDGDSTGEIDPSPVDESVNPGLSGHLFSESSGEYAYVVDVPTGIARLIPNTDWESQDDRIPQGVAQFYKRMVQNRNDQFLSYAIYCKGENEDPLAEDLSCIFLQDFNGNYLAQLDLLHDVYEAQLSPDGKYITVFRDFNSAYPDEEWLEIFTLNGTLISDRKLSSRTLQWLNSGRLVFANRTQFVFTKPISTDGEYTLTLPSQTFPTDGWIQDFDISADQTQIVFTYATE
ncbi:MAG: hypothetical protein ABW095_09070 [Candidatus Thiodiazotropha sp.]